MSHPALGAVRFAVRDASRPLVVVGPSLGTSVEALWQDAAALLTDDMDVLGWDLPGHGTSPALDDPASYEGMTFEAIVKGVLEVVARAQAERGDVGAPFWFAGVSASGAVGLRLLLDAPERVAGAALICTGARIGTPEGWHERADLVAAAGTPTQVSGSAERWFAPGFVAAQPQVATRLLASLQVADRFAYAAVCRALASFDVRDRLGEITAPVVAVAGGHDRPTPVASLEEIAAGVPGATLTVLGDVAHLAPAEAPAEVAEAVRRLVGLVPPLPDDVAVASGAPVTVAPGGRTAAEAHAEGMAVRRAVLSDAHVDRASARTTAFTADFQDLITRYAWGEIWTRPGLDRRMRSAVTLTALVAGGHWDELAMHVRAARRNGLSVEEIGEVLLQTAIYCSVPTANHAFAVAQAVLAEDGEI
ncbi:bifunctional 3-oxoadipate enol-lactonase/4-carboxymuconolactone decarboxylase PcaDC [Antribacter soli]